MGITVDVIPLAPGEEPEQAISRAYDRPASWQPSAGWQTTCVEALRPMHQWHVEGDTPNTCLWSREVRWQLEFHRRGVTLRLRRPDLEVTAVSDADILRAFADLPVIVHVPDNGWWCTLGDLADDMEILR